MGSYRIRRPRLRIATKFWLVLGLLVTCQLATVLVGAHAQARMKTEAERQYSENIVTCIGSRCSMPPWLRPAGPHWR
jgi:hypothetical protein